VLGLRDILDGRTHRCIVPSGHRGAKGELWYVRLLPPRDERFDHGVCFNRHSPDSRRFRCLRAAGGYRPSALPTILSI
jgi:hypothetical protein